MLSDSIKITEKIIEENNIIIEDYYQQDIKYKLLNILENIFEIDSEEKNTKRRNSFNFFLFIEQKIINIYLNGLHLFFICIK